MIGILDVGMGNLQSVSNAIYSLGYEFVVLKDSKEWDTISHLIIPGVGSFKTAMESIHERHLLEPILKFRTAGHPILGICLGMQLLADYGDEGGGIEGLGLVPGRVLRMDDSIGVHLPHVGWNNVQIQSAQGHPVFKRIKDDTDFYFVHSYAFNPAENKHALGQTEYGRTFCSIVGKDNTVGFQFHPEKSQTNGLRLLENFCEWNG